MADGTNVQVSSTMEISEAIHALKTLVGEMADSTSTLASKSNETTVISQQGRNQMDEMSDTIQEFQNDFRSIMKTTDLLVEKLLDTEKFS